MTSSDDFRRLVRAQIPEELIPGVFRDGARVTDGLPIGSQLVRMYKRPELHAEECIFRHEDFDVVPEAGNIPLYDLTRDIPFHGISRGDRTKNDGASEVAMSHEVFSALFWEGTEVHHDLPKDTRFRTMYEDESRRTVVLQFLSEEFEKPEEGDPVPRLDVHAGNLWGINLADEQADNDLISSYVGER